MDLKKKKIEDNILLLTNNISSLKVMFNDFCERFQPGIYEDVDLELLEYLLNLHFQIQASKKELCCLIDLLNVTDSTNNEENSNG